MHHRSSTYRLLVGTVALGLLSCVMLPVASQAYATVAAVPMQHVNGGMDTCDDEAMSREAQCGCCVVEAPMPTPPEAVLQSNTLKHDASLPSVALVDTALLFEDADVGGLATSGIYISRSVRLHVLHATFLN